MAVTDPLAIKFVNERIRPVAETLRDLKIRLEELLAVWNQGVGSLVPNSAGETIEDGREAEGVSRLTGQDVNLMVTRINAVLAPLKAVLTMDVVHKTVVRPVQPNG